MLCFGLTVHEFIFYNGCFKSDGMTGVLFHGEGMMFINEEMESIFTFPSFMNISDLSLPNYKNFAASNRTQCLSKIRSLIKEEVNITETEGTYLCVMCKCFKYEAVQ